MSSIKTRISRLEKDAMARPSGYEGTPLADWTLRDCLRGLCAGCMDAPERAWCDLLNDPDATEDDFRAFIRAHGDDVLLQHHAALEAAAVADAMEGASC